MLRASLGRRVRSLRIEPLEQRTLLSVFADVGSLGLTAVESSSVVWGDYDNDGQLDVLLTGSDTSGDNVANIYHNNGDGTFSDIGAGLTAVSDGSVAWGDYDNDGLLDILLTGANDAGNPIAKIYHNAGGGVFNEISTTLTGVKSGSVAWGDYDNDGLLDILLTGTDSVSYPVAKVYHNDGNGVFNEVAAGLTAVSDSSVAWGDYDNDGRLDILAAGANAVGSPITTLYHNAGNGVFTEISTTLAGVSSASVAWGDYDNDGRLDILLAGTNDAGDPVATLYHNDGSGTFSDISAGLTGVTGGSASWGDYDNDGRLDILLTGADELTDATTILYHNDGNGVFHDAAESLTDVSKGSASWGDYDSDGRLDILLTGAATASPIVNFYHSGASTADTAPAAPTNLNATTDASSNSVALSWNASTDGQTPSAGLTYNIRIGTTSGEGDIVSATADANGLRQLVEQGSITGTTWTLYGLTAGQTYYWSVQSVDSALVGSAWAEEGTFMIGLPTLSIDDVTLAETESGTTDLIFTVTLSQASSQDVTVQYATEDETATAGSDYAATSGTLTILAGQTTGTIAVPINSDTSLESDETFFLNLSGAVGADITDDQGVGTIQNLALQPTDISLSNATVRENQAAGTEVGTLSTTDPDDDAPFTYTLVAGDGSTDNASFTIDGDTLKTTAGFDFETQDTYSIRVRSTDESDLSTEKILTITVTDSFDIKDVVVAEAGDGVKNGVVESNEPFVITWAVDGADSVAGVSVVLDEGTDSETVLTTIYGPYTAADGSLMYAAVGKANVLAAGEHTYTITVEDGNGLVTTTADTFNVEAGQMTISDVIVTEHGTKDGVLDTTDQILITWAVTDNNPMVTSATLTIDGTTSARDIYGPYSSSSADTTYWAGVLNSLTAGTHSYTITVYDFNGLSQTYTDTFTVSAGALSIQGVVVAETDGQNRDQVLKSNEPLILTWAVKGAISVTDATLTIDGQNVSTIHGPYYSLGSHLFGGSIGTLSAGEHTYAITVVSNTGVTASLTGTFTVVTA